MNHLIFDSPKFLHWKKKIQSNGIRIDKLEVLAEISRDQQTLFGAFIDCVFTTPEGETVPRCIFIKGESVIVVPVLTCEKGQEKYTLMIEQRRIADGELNLEFPGGMMDLKVDDPLSVAVQEIEEELGIKILKDELYPLGAKPIKVCAAVLDEVAHFFYFQKMVSCSFLEEMDGRSTGRHDEGEYLRIRVQKISEVYKNHNFSALVGIKLLEQKLNWIFQKPYSEKQK